MFKNLLELEKSKKTTENSPFSVKEFGETMGAATKLSSREYEDRKSFRTAADRLRAEAEEELKQKARTAGDRKLEQNDRESS